MILYKSNRNQKVTDDYQLKNDSFYTKKFWKGWTNSHFYDYKYLHNINSWFQLPSRLITRLFFCIFLNNFIFVGLLKGKIFLELYFSFVQNLQIKCYINTSILELYNCNTQKNNCNFTHKKIVYFRKISIFSKKFVKI